MVDMRVFVRPAQRFKVAGFVCCSGALNAENVALAAELASVPERIRGYGHVKEAHLHAAKQHEAELLARWRTPVAVREVVAQVA